MKTPSWRPRKKILSFDRKVRMQNWHPRKRIGSFDQRAKTQN
jgi:hypothetical protein